MAQAIRFDSEIYRKRIGAAVRRELEEWKSHPELSKIVKRMESLSRPDQFLDAFAEYAIARRFVQSGCQIVYEVPTVGGKSADFKVCHGTTCLFVHVKRLNPDENHSRQEKLEPLFVPLDDIKRPVHVELHLRADLNHDQALAARELAKPFVRSAVKGEEASLFADGVKLGTARVLGDSGCDHAATWPHFGIQECTDRQRMPKKLSQAHDQFMPGATNVIFLAWNWVTDRDLEDFENTLLGGTWGMTAFDSEMRPRTVLEGRTSDGFWSGEKHPDSQAAGCFRFLLTTGEIEAHKLWIREGHEGKIPDWFTGIF